MARRRVALTDIGGDRDTICTKPFLDAADGLRATLGTKSTELDFLFKQVRENTDRLTVAESLWSGGRKSRAIRTAQAKVQVMQVRYSQDHQYIIVEDGVGTVGITNHAQEKLSDVTLVELPHVGEQVKKGGAVGVVESVKAASDLYSPVSGEILGVNEALIGKPQLVNEDAEGAGWIYKIKLAEPSELDTLLDREAYLAYVGEQG